MFIRLFSILLLFYVLTGYRSWPQTGLLLTTSKLPGSDSVLTGGLSEKPAPVNTVPEQKRINVFVLNRSKKIDMACISIRINAGFARMFRRKIKVITARSCTDLAEKMNALIKKNPDKKIGHLWIDSHGKYKTGNSLFYIGKDTIGISNINMLHIKSPLASIAGFCDENSSITIGSCYSAADYMRPGNKSITASKMDGDVLLGAVSGIFSRSSVYGCESWIMVKPFMFGRRWGIAGYPLELKYLDEVYRPVWERMGKWKSIEAGSKEVKSVTTPYLKRNGDLAFNKTDYLRVKKHRKKLKKKLKKLKPGMYRSDRK